MRSVSEESPNDWQYGWGRSLLSGRVWRWRSVPLSCISFCLLCSLSNDGIEDQRQARQYRWPAGFKQRAQEEGEGSACFVGSRCTGLSISSSCSGWVLWRRTRWFLRFSFHWTFIGISSSTDVDSTNVHLELPKLYIHYFCHGLNPVLDLAEVINTGTLDTSPHFFNPKFPCL